MKKVKDFYYTRAKQENYPARSVYKLSEVQNKYKLIPRGSRILDLGCHPGSWTIYAAREAGPGGLVVGIDLQQGKEFNEPGGAGIHLLHGDIEDPLSLAAIKAICATFDLVLSDMAPSTTGDKFSNHIWSVRLAQRALAVALEVLAAQGSFYCKVFQGEDFPTFVSEVRSHFKTVRTVKPPGSRPESREMFVLGTGFRGVE